MRKDELRRLTRLELLDAAKKLEIRGRSTMSKDELVEAVASAQKRPEAKTEEPKPTPRPKAEAKREEPKPTPRPRAEVKREEAKPPDSDRPGSNPPGPTPPRPRAADDEDEEGKNWNSVSLGRDPNYGRFLSPGSIPPRPGAPPRRGGPANGGPRPIGESLSERSERGRMRAGERSYGAREELRRTGDARRQSGYTPRYARPTDARTERPSRGHGDANRQGRDVRGEGSRPRPDSRPGPDRRGGERSGGGQRHDPRQGRFTPGGRPAAPGGLQDDAEIGVESRAEMILEAPRAPRDAAVTSANLGREREAAEAPSGAPVAPVVPGSLPRHYGIDRCKVMVRDPRCVHAYWEIRNETLDRARGDLGEDWEGHRRILRVHGIPISGDVNEPAAESFDLDVTDEATSQYVTVPRANRGYRIDVGVMTKSGLFYPLASSNTVITPRDGVSLNQTENWAAPPASSEAAPAAAAGPARTAEPVPAPPAPAPSATATAPSGALRADFSGAGRMAEESSREVLFESGRGLIPPGPGIPPGAEAPTSPAGAAPTSAQRGEGAFWFVLNTELIVYGATVPDAKVTLQGKPVRLRPDGTFSLRFQLPDGAQELRAEAVSADGRFVRTITPTVTRSTTSEESNPNAGADA